VYSSIQALKIANFESGVLMRVLLQTIRLVSGFGVAVLLMSTGCTSKSDSNANDIGHAAQGYYALNTAYVQNGNNCFWDDENNTDICTLAVDIRIDQNDPTSNSYGFAKSLAIGGDEPAGTGMDSSAIIRWDLSSFSPAWRIVDASITLTILDPTSTPFMIYPLKRQWLYSDVNWQSTGLAPWQVQGALGANDRDSLPMAAVPTDVSNEVEIRLRPSAIPTVAGWIHDYRKNLGVIIGDTSSSDTLVIASSYASDVNTRPKLKITYLPSCDGSGGGCPGF
jgi:hypothetical protein